MLSVTSPIYTLFFAQVWREGGWGWDVNIAKKEIANIFTFVNVISFITCFELNLKANLLHTYIQFFDPLV